jgi:hypothetical protein
MVAMGAEVVIDMRIESVYAFCGLEVFDCAWRLSLEKMACNSIARMESNRVVSDRVTHRR